MSFNCIYKTKYWLLDWSIDQSIDQSSNQSINSYALFRDVSVHVYSVTVSASGTRRSFWDSFTHGKSLSAPTANISVDLISLQSCAALKFLFLFVLNFVNRLVGYQTIRLSECEVRVGLQSRCMWLASSNLFVFSHTRQAYLSDLWPFNCTSSPFFSFYWGWIWVWIWHLFSSYDASLQWQWAFWGVTFWV